MKTSFKSAKAKLIIAELFSCGVSNANIAQFLNDSGYAASDGDVITEDMIRGLCRKIGLKRTPGWNLPRKGAGPRLSHRAAWWLILAGSVAVFGFGVWFLTAGGL